ncbi:EscU/YscU/HrcU family type III secretion system export apparatus switch protein [Sedimentitalea nanhaiensis]|uniref:Flagellar biosynthetic protein FlhB n=1 Tax=Sedimentitalea nanhaiensis TaxID=999627 RepID=A0A1I7C7S6_9RHOB|nr:flagellar type III secretion system protein FlhB [Sedimentitalea nanhaiensis]SFT95486.1 flagellar biosynthetic protein FlhB [Sedimentitalea nanhaiensis]
MSEGAQDESEKSHEATPQKLLKAREKGEVAKSTDLSVAASYGGLLLAALAAGAESVRQLGTTLTVLLDQPESLSDLILTGPASAPVGALLNAVARSLAPWFVIPALAVLLSILAQRAFVVAPSKIQPKLSRISLISNAKNKFGRSGLFEFAKSFVKLLLYSICLGLFLKIRLPDVVALIGSSPMLVASQLARMCIEFLFLVLLIATVIGGIDAVWQHKEHLRKNMMSRKEVTDESKEAEGDPHFKQKRRQRGQEIAMNQMMAEVPNADVIVVNPTHYAVALKWSRTPGAAPICVAKGVDEIAASIRNAANLAGVPIHHDPPTARALHATVELGQEILEEQYLAVAAAIRFAERMRKRAKGQV